MSYTLEQWKQVLDDAVRANWPAPEYNGGVPFTREAVAAITAAPISVADAEALIAQIETTQAAAPGDHRTYTALASAMRAQFESQFASSNKNSRLIWERMIRLLDAYDKLGPCPVLYRLGDAPVLTPQDAQDEIDKWRASQAAFQEYHDRANALGIDL